MTAPRATLPELPKVELEIESDTRVGEGGFLVLRRTQLVATADNGERSAPFLYDAIDRRAFDASVMVAHHEENGRVFVWLRTCLRPPLALRDTPVTPVLWEVPAGLVEPGESPRAAAARELAEELGFDVPESALVDLGPPSHPAPAMIGEAHHFFHVEVDPKTRTAPAGDGSPVEAGAIVACLSLEDALDACRRGELRDEKTELALRRLADTVA